MEIKLNDKPVLFGEERMGPLGAGVVRLHRPQVLNALNTQCYELLEPKLRAWAKNPEIGFLIFEGAGEKAFSAGGDVKNLVLGIRERGLVEAFEFFTAEYYVDCYVHAYKKPIVAFADGITMGAGVGLMNGASHRIVTEKTLWAMPEVSIGFFPDVGATRYLGVLPKGAGIFLGVTGARISGADAVALGLADFYMESRLKRKVMADLLRLPLEGELEKDKKIITEYLKHALPQPPESAFLREYEKVESIFSQDDFSQVKSQFLSLSSLSPFLKEAQERLRKGAPMGQQVFFEACRRHKKLSWSEVFAAEWGMAIEFSKGHDFADGVRAVLIDKDHKPSWQNEKNRDVESYFNTAEENLLRKKFAQALF